MERIHVTVRARPLSSEDAKTSPWRISGNSIFPLNNHFSKFEFDRIFGEDCKTAEVYEARTKEIVTAAVRGFNGTVFAYGQTNSGKTHTMRGSSSEPGVLPKAVHELFNILQEDVDREFLLRMSYMEIYNEDINDLLAPEHRKLQIHESLERGIHVAGLREEIVGSPQQVLDFMEFGESHRHIGETNMNVYSSRSHTIFRMIIESREKTEDDEVSGSNSTDAVRVSVLNLVDLAGSERAAKTGAEGVRLKEGSHINKSLMTLGTVIKKLSEGAESQGGHVPYRDSKLTRILQPALGGNANTAIICNITLAQVHADETKSSLQFASRALRVTNCARVNEILTDAALLKRQKKEIEELRAKLQGSHSDHFEKEILNLRNQLLQSELEIERMASELEEEKKAQVEHEKVLQEQAKKIKNLSSIVLYSNRDESRDQLKKNKRRDTWCPGNLLRGTAEEVYSDLQPKNSAAKSVRPERYLSGPLLAFDELMVEDDACEKDEDRKTVTTEDCAIPDPCSLLHVTNRRKMPAKKKYLSMGGNDLMDIQAEYEDLFVEFETERTVREIEIDCLRRKLTHGDKNVSLRESEAISVIKQLQEKIKMLEMEKSSSQQNLDSVFELATEQNICAQENLEALQEELQNEREEARAARQQLASCESALSTEIEDIIFEVWNTEEVAESVSSLLHDVLHSFSAISDAFHEMKAMTSEFSQQQKSIISDYEKLSSSMKQKISDLQNERLLLHNQSVDLQKEIEELRANAENYKASLTAVSEQQDGEKSELLSHIQILEREILCLSSNLMAKEKETLRKDLEKTKTKLKETESKLRNAIQDKTKLEGEKAVAEREVKRLHSQKTLLERDISKRDSLAGRRRDSVADRGSKLFDPKRTKGPSVAEQTMQEEYRKLEVMAFEMETTIGSLEEELAAANQEKEEVTTRNEDLVLELDALSEKFQASNSELLKLQEEISTARFELDESNGNREKLETSINKLLEEKEELATQLTESLLEIEEEKAIWCSKEKASIEAIEEKSRVYSTEIASLSKDLLEARNLLHSYKEEYEVVSKKLASYEEEATLEKNCRMEQSVEIDRLEHELQNAETQNKQYEELLNSKLKELQCFHEKVEALENELSFLNKERENLFLRVKELDRKSDSSNDIENVRSQLLIMTEARNKLATQIEEQRHIEAEFVGKHCDDALLNVKVQAEEQFKERLSSIELKAHMDQVENNIQLAKLRMRLRGTKAQLDAIHLRYKQAINESDIMNKKFEESASILKDRLASKGIEVLNLKKQLNVGLGQQIRSQ
ncbi:hypothetical protein ACFE04_029495 [Oxalis oulophora]